MERAKKERKKGTTRKYQGCNFLSSSTFFENFFHQPTSHYPVLLFRDFYVPLKPKKARTFFGSYFLFLPIKFRTENTKKGKE
jgi:hypothetical protein